MELQEKLEIIKQELLAELGEQKSVLAAMAEPELKKFLHAIVKKGLMPAIKAGVEESKTKIDDLVWAAIDDKVEAILQDIIEKIKL